MPLVRVALRRGRTPEELAAIGESIYTAMVETINVPVNDKFIIFSEHDANTLQFNRNYLSVERSDGFLAIHIALRRGRTVEMKRALYRRMAELLKQNAGIRPQDVMIGLTENEPADWSFGNGLAQYVA